MDETLVGDDMLASPLFPPILRLRRLLGFDVPQITSSDLSRRPRIDSQLIKNKALVVVDGRSIAIDTSDVSGWNIIPVTLPEVNRVEVWKESLSAVHEDIAYHIVIKIITKPGRK